ncbi:ELM2 domain-containing protein [Actinidia rufa]|uniref:ELM2 domain-containing protein n=1 Tax=Actinidia rufa TaxID=165716 RepID=A0A7J0GAI9_9ERIC|nr:ELM2 domain-containing protein [Actinidia rufa]
MVQKRPCANEESYEVSSKHPRQMEFSNHLVSFLEFIPDGDAEQPPNTPGEGEGSFTDLPTEKDGKTGIPSCLYSVSWDSSSISKEDDGSEEPFHLSSSPVYYSPVRPVRTVVRCEEIYTSLLNGPPRKLVPVGPDFQADVPEWPVQGTKNIFNSSYGSESLTLFHQASEFDLSGPSEEGNKLAGTCVIPTPGLGSFGDRIGDGRTDCCCGDSGSVRCVRQHVKEAREKLWRTLGPKRFSELGFFNMGEVVANKWSLEEEQLFHDVVFSNPASSDKNFWNQLSMVFPSRTKNDIVSYYFNVFMLRVRSEQNRLDPPNIDSDDDEWQVSDDSGDDSAVESPREDPDHNEIRDNYLREHEDDSAELEHILWPCETKDWELGYLTFPKNENEFLPTCSVIEEVFGVGDWDYKARDR